MFSFRRFAYAIALGSLVFLAACGGTEAKKAGVVFKTIDDRFAIKVGERVVQMQLAADAKEMEKGLMFRKTMGAEEGMLFLYAAPQQMNFWMHDTDLPLDIGFFDAKGELKEIYQMYPHDDMTVSSHGKSLQFALEMNQGWYKQAGVKPGAKLDLKAVAEALQERGKKPEAMGVR